MPGTTLLMAPLATILVEGKAVIGSYNREPVLITCEQPEDGDYVLPWGRLIVPV